MIVFLRQNPLPVSQTSTLLIFVSLTAAGNQTRRHPDVQGGVVIAGDQNRTGVSSLGIPALDYPVILIPIICPIINYFLSNSVPYFQAQQEVDSKYNQRYLIGNINETLSGH